jgi:flagellar motility protein MotE (MotC chaperone)
MEQKKLMQFLIAGKLVLVVCAFALYQGWIQVGDLPIFAGESEKTEQKDEKIKDDKAEKTAKADDTSDKKEDDDPATKKRKSFLSDLFELPKLDPQKAQKQEVGKYLDLADRKGRQITERESMLANKEQQLKDLEASIDLKLAKLDEERKFIAKTLQQEKDLKSERLDKLVELYDKMEPKKAAPQFEKIDQDLAVALFKRLKQK